MLVFRCHAEFCPGTDTVRGTDISRQIYVRSGLPILDRVRMKPLVALTLGVVGRVPTASIDFTMADDCAGEPPPLLFRYLNYQVGESPSEANRST